MPIGTAVLTLKKKRTSIFSVLILYQCLMKFQFLFVSTDSLHCGTIFRPQFGISVKNIICADIYFSFKQYISYAIAHIFIIIQSFNRYIIQLFPKHLIHLLCRKGNSSILNAYLQRKNKNKNKKQAARYM